MKNLGTNQKFLDNEVNLLIDFKNPRLYKVAIVVSAVLGIVASTYIFADKYTLQFRSPFQNPLIINERVIEIEYKEPVLEATESATIKETSYSPSQTLVAHTQQRPDVYSRIVAMFGSESMKYGELISRESSLNPQAINPSSGACGLAQALPCEKMQCSLEDVDCQLAWIKNYVNKRYGNIDNALAFHDSNNWY